MVSCKSRGSGTKIQKKGGTKKLLKMLLPAQTSRGRGASDNISRDNEGSRACRWFLYSNFSPLGKTPSIFCTCEQFLYIFIPNNFEPLGKTLFWMLCRCSTGANPMTLGSATKVGGSGQKSTKNGGN